MDFAERAFQAAETYTADALTRHESRRLRENVISSCLHCVACGIRIPSERRALVPGCERCVDCQSAMERDKRC